MVKVQINIDINNLYGVRTGEDHCGGPRPRRPGDTAGCPEASEGERGPGFVRRAFERFDQEPFTEQAARDWVKGQQVYASHLFEPQERQEPGPPAAPRPQSPAIDYSAIKDPAARLTAFRAAEAQQEGQRP